MIYFQNYGAPISIPSKDADSIRSREKDLDCLRSRITSERPQSVLSRIHDRGRLTADERIKKLKDKNAAIWFFGDFQGEDKRWRLGVICAITTVCDRQVMIIANDNTQSAGAWFPDAPRKIIHAQQTAKRLGIPVVYLVECAGLFLPDQEKTFAASDGAGRIFEMQAQIARSSILQIAAVFGDCIAGGGYMPLLCNKIVMTEQAALCIGGSALHTQAKSGSQDHLGGPDVHVHQSGCADTRVPDDLSAIEKLREWISLMPSPASEFFRLDEPLDSPYPCDDLYHLIPSDPAVSLNIQEILARLTDGAQYQILLGYFGKEITAALALIDGLPIVYIANSGSILYRDGIHKMRTVAAAAREDGIPVIWLQDVAGFDIGKNAEQQGLLRYGAMLLQELSNDSNEVPPALTILIRKSSGAGYYAMKGAPFHPAWIVSTVMTRLEVMRPDVLGGVVYDRKIARLQNTPESQEILENLESEKKNLINRQISNGDCLAAAQRGDVDDIVPLNQLRELCISFARAAYQSAAKPHKPHRLWTLLDLNNDSIPYTTINL